MLQSPPSPQNNVETISSPTRLPRVGVYFTDAGTQLGKLLFNIVLGGRGEPSKVCHKHGRLFHRHRYPRNAPRNQVHFHRHASPGASMRQGACTRPTGNAPPRNHTHSHRRASPRVSRKQGACADSKRSPQKAHPLPPPCLSKARPGTSPDKILCHASPEMHQTMLLCFPQVFLGRRWKTLEDVLGRRWHVSRFPLEDVNL